MIKIAIMLIMFGTMQFVDGYTIAFVGDIGSNQTSVQVRDSIVKQNPDYLVILGDMTYQRNFDWFNANYNYSKCVIGNHDLNFNLSKQAIQMCGEFWTLEIKNNLFIGINTEGNLFKTYSQILPLLEANKIFIVGHRPCLDLYPDFRAQLVLEFCKKILEIDPEIKFISAHHHVLGYSELNQTQYIAGGGGKSHGSCDIVKGIWKFCAAEFGYLLLEIDDDIKATFYSVDGKKLYSP